MQPEILYEDAYLLVCRKPAGVATQTRRTGQQDMESLLRNYRARNGEQPFIGVVQRLDQPVEGVMVFAKDSPTAAALSEQVRTHKLGKHYCAAVGVPGGVRLTEEAVLTDWLDWDRRTNTGWVDAPGTSGKKAELSYRVVSRTGETALLDISLKTGRHHQIRLQLAHMGCPILGDRKYGGAQTEASGYGGAQGAAGAHMPLALCAYRLTFAHPGSGKRMDISVRPEHALLRDFPLYISAADGYTDT